MSKLFNVRCTQCQKEIILAVKGNGKYTGYCEHCDRTFPFTVKNKRLECNGVIESSYYDNEVDL